MPRSRRPETCVGAVVVSDEALLLIRREREPARGQWSVPGGRVEWGETLREAVEREVAEETGLEVTCGAYIGFVERISDRVHYVIHDFAATPMATGPLLAGDDAAEVAWVPIPDLASVDLVDGMLAFLVEHGIAAEST